MRKVVPLRQMSQAHEDQMIAKPDKTQFPRRVFILIHCYSSICEFSGQS